MLSLCCCFEFRLVIFIVYYCDCVGAVFLMAFFVAVEFGFACAVAIYCLSLFAAVFDLGLLPVLACCLATTWVLVFVALWFGQPLVCLLDFGLQLFTFVWLLG